MTMKNQAVSNNNFEEHDEFFKVLNQGINRLANAIAHKSYKKARKIARHQLLPFEWDCIEEMGGEKTITVEYILNYPSYGLDSVTIPRPASKPIVKAFTAKAQHVSEEDRMWFQFRSEIISIAAKVAKISDRLARKHNLDEAKLRLHIIKTYVRIATGWEV